MDINTSIPEKIPQTPMPTLAPTTYQLLSFWTVLFLLLVAALFHLAVITLAALATGETVNSAAVLYSFIRKTMREGATGIRLLVNRRGVYRSTRTTSDNSNHHGFGGTDGQGVVLEEIIA